MLRRIWNGPFSLGPLNQEPSFAQITVKLLEVAWKTAVVTAYIGLLLFFLHITDVIYRGYLYGF